MISNQEGKLSTALQKNVQTQIPTSNASNNKQQTPTLVLTAADATVGGLKLILLAKS